MPGARAHLGRPPRAGHGRPARVRLGVVLLAVLALTAASLVGRGLTDTSAAFVDTGSGTGSFQAATPVAATIQPCANNPDGNTVTISWTYSGPAPASFDVLVNSTVIITVPGTARAVTLAGGGLLLLGINQPISVRTTYSPTWTAQSGSVAINVISLLGLAAVRCA